MRGKLLLLLLAIAFIAGCADKPYTPVDDLSQDIKGDKTYKVAAGDTLFSIAWRFDKDYRQLAAANQIPEPYIIHVGQVLQLNQAASYRVKRPKAQASTANQKSLPSVTKSEKSAGKKPSTGVSRTLPNVVKANPNDAGWLWPAQGSVVKNFSVGRNVNKGIDIKAANADVISSRSGKVVYAGNKLKGYGNLIIVKHSNTYLSAYAHNKTLLVKEGDWVKQGQQIAKLGSTNSKYAVLHFEIRKQGKPVNPLQYLKK
jgi:lipoprotein NlpD